MSKEEKTGIATPAEDRPETNGASVQYRSRRGRWRRRE